LYDPSTAVLDNTARSPMGVLECRNAIGLGAVPTWSEAWRPLRPSL
jgi:hypothetical protein